MSYEFLEHTADVKFRAEGLSVEGMFVEAVSALNETIYGEMKVLERIEKSFEVEGKDWESLLYNFLEEFLYLLDAESFLVSSVKKIEIDGFKLKCVVVGDDADNYKFTSDVKAVTYSEMRVFREENNSTRTNTDQHGLEKGGVKMWVCEVVLDV